MNPLKQLAGQTAIYGLSSIVGRLLNYLLVPLYTRYFIPAEYGVVTELYAYVAFLVIVLTYGLETAFFRFSQKQYDKKLVYSTSLISLIISSILFVVLMFFSQQPIANWLEYPQNPEYVIWFALIIGMDAISSISFAKLREQRQAARFALVRLVNIFINIGLNLFFIIYCPYALDNNLPTTDFVNSVYDPAVGVGYIFIANLFASIVTILMLFPEMIKSSWKFNSILWKKMMIYALPLLIAGLAGMTNETIDRILLKQLLPEGVDKMAEIGVYGAFYKISIIMILFIQTFRFAAEPFFFSQEKQHNSRKIYADVLKYFTILASLIFLSVMLYLDVVKHFVGSSFHSKNGIEIVPILLMANLFLGIYYNLSIWYKLTEKTVYGAMLAFFGALITLGLNFILIPKIGFVGSAWATLACYFSMTLASLLIGKKHYPIPYDLKRIFTYIILSFALYKISIYFETSMLINTTYLFVFVIVVFILEKSKKEVISEPELFD
ncbi:MAG: oligosaccharide flippase family protein [Flavobacteriales bacterium]|nr:oligosaccharide flippase family protein [Flavobacteriales bacterium]